MKGLVAKLPLVGAVLTTLALRDNTELYKKYTEDQAFQDDLNEMIFNLTYLQSG